MDGSLVMEPQTSRSRMRRPRVEIKSVNLALQGGGAQGAFTWGVLDRLLEDERIAFARRAQGQLTRRCSPAV